MDKSRAAIGPLELLACAFLWGTAFSAQSSAMKHLGPCTFVFLRCAITGAILFAARPLLRKIAPGTADFRPFRETLRVGVVCGAFLVLATILQQVGLVTTIPAKSGFITALYIIIVPLLGVFVGRKPGPRLLFSALLSLVGLYLLCMTGAAGKISSGDLVTLGSAFVFAVHILLIDRTAKDLDAVLLSAIQFSSGAVFAGIAALTRETVTFSQISACAGSLLYVAVFSGALGYTLQIAGQKRTDPTVASLILCLESVFSAIGGWVLLGQTLTIREWLGCAIMLLASICALIPARAARTDL